MINFFQNLALFWVKNANFFAKCFGENILKIITSVPALFDVMMTIFSYKSNVQIFLHIFLAQKSAEAKSVDKFQFEFIKQTCL
jgi:hypothetical protein